MSDKNKKKDKGNPLVDPLSMKDFRKERRSYLRSKYRPLQRELNKQERISKLQSQRTSDYYKQYQRTLRGVGQATTAGFNQAGAMYGDALQTASAGDTALRARLATDDAAQAQLQGGMVSSAGSDRLLDNQARVLQSGAGVQAAIAAEGANQRAFIGSSRANSKLSRIGALSALANERDQIAADRLALLRERADDRRTYITDTREGERRYKLANKELRATRKENARDRAFQASENAKDRAASAAADSQTGGQGHGKAKQENQKAQRKAYQKAKALLPSFAPDKGEPSPSPGEVIAGLVSKGIPPRIAKKVVHDFIKSLGGKGKGGGGHNPIKSGGDWITG